MTKTKGKLNGTPFRTRSHPTLPIRIGALIYKPDDDAADVDEQPIYLEGGRSNVYSHQEISAVACD
jgi:hypothetical protein